MFPSYGFSPLYPYQRGQKPPHEYLHPRWEAFPSRMMVDANSPPMYEPWRHNNGHHVPVPCHPCCGSHHCTPSYCFSFPYPHFPSTACFPHCSGGYSAYPESYAVHHSPPSHNTMEQPRYEYDKKSEYRCCGCPNHPSHAKEDKSIKIEEQEAETEKANDFAQSKNKKSSVCIPCEYDETSKKQQRMTELDDCEDAPCIVKPKVCNGLFPLSTKSIEPLMQSGDGTRTQDQQGKGKNSQLSIPVIWLPSDNSCEDEARDKKETMAHGKPAEEPPSCRVLPMKSQTTDDNTDNHNAEVANHRNGIGTKSVDKTSNLKTIPVKQMEESAKMNMKVDVNGKEGDTSVEIVKDKSNKKSAEKGIRKEPSSPTKNSKLLPVCLRVDPLPKKKNGCEGSSQSPSPYRHKEKQTQNDALKSIFSGSDENVEYDSKTMKANKDNSKEQQRSKEIELTEIMDISVSEKDNEISCVEHTVKDVTNARIMDNGVPDRTIVSIKEADDSKSSNSEKEEKIGGQDKFKAEEKGSQIGIQLEGQILSVIEAAIIIQSAYRGYQVRKWEPLRKLKQIAKAREETAELKCNVEALKMHNDLDDKQKVAFGESIMKLLLKLDTIQGLHQSVRDIRKSVTKELISLQEKLDSMESEKFKASPTENSTAKIVEESSICSSLHESSRGGEEVSRAIDEDNQHFRNEGTPDAFLDREAGGSGKELATEMVTVLALPGIGSAPNDDIPQVIGGSLCTTVNEAALVKTICGVNSKVIDEMVTDGSLKEPELAGPEFASVTLDCQQAKEVNPCSTANEEILCGLTSIVADEVVTEDIFTKSEGVDLNEKPGEKYVRVLNSELVEQCNQAIANTQDDLKLLAEVPQSAIEKERGQVVTEDDLLELEIDAGPARKDVVMDKLVEPSRATDEQELVEISNAEAPIEQDIRFAAKDDVTLIGIEPNEEQVERMLEFCAEEALSTKHDDTTDLQEDRELPKHVVLEVREQIGATGRQTSEDACTAKSDSKSIPLVISYENDLQKDETVYQSIVIEDEEGKYLEDDKLAQIEQIDTGNGKIIERAVEDETVEKTVKERSNKILEENEKLREMMEKLMMVGKEQQAVISYLGGKVKDLERRLARRHKLKARRPRSKTFHASSCGKL